ncbi:MAG TPA: non-canonical purine NTP pyrophosphatase [Candidatus Saccharimonadales bacterium]|nr:non-canonical purine NTP pyrophosphatase [Candidatus Saccharimonadales bacterium]
MRKITIVTGNPGKVRELQAMAMGKLSFVTRDLEIAEIQSLDLEEIVRDKAKKAYAQIKGPVIVDDVSAGLDSLQGLPGPFIKFFNSQIGGDSLWQLSKSKNEIVTVSCIAAYYDGAKLLMGKGTIQGIVVEPRGKNGFGFDAVIVPDGQLLTMAEMTEEQKMRVSHRGKAFRDLIQQLEKLK